MKKLLKALGLAALVGCIPLNVRQDEEEKTLSIHALLWNVKISPDPENPEKKNVVINAGFSNPFAKTCCCGGNCHCHDDDECCCHDDDCCCQDEEPCCEEAVTEDCCATPSENPENN